MQEYKTRQRAVMAEQFDGEYLLPGMFYKVLPEKAGPWIATGIGDRPVNPGDWLVLHSNGVEYLPPINAIEFEQNYQALKPVDQYAKEKPSEEFLTAFLSAGSLLAIDCICGRTHFCDPNVSFGDYEPGEYEEILEKQKKSPLLYIENADVGSISYAQLPGGQFVFDCPCNYATRIEEFIHDYKHSIADYYGTMLAEAELEAKRMQGIYLKSTRDQENKK